MSAISTRTAGLSLVFVLAAAGQTANEIIAKVAANQDRTIEARQRYVFTQDVLVRMLRGNGKLAHEEQRTYTVTPTASHFERKLTHFAGKRIDGKREIPLGPVREHEGVDIDGEIATSLAEDLGVKEGSRDGIDDELFPLTTKRIADYHFKLLAASSAREAMSTASSSARRTKTTMTGAGRVKRSWMRRNFSHSKSPLILRAGFPSS